MAMIKPRGRSASKEKRTANATIGSAGRLRPGSRTEEKRRSSIRRNLSFDPVRDFTYIALGARSPYYLIAHPSLGGNSVAELVALLKKQPGKLNYASSGAGSTPSEMTVTPISSPR